MVPALDPISIYVTRWKPFLMAVVFAGGIPVDLLYYFVWPTPMVTANPWEYQEPFKTILFVFIMLTFGGMTLFGLYGTLTPYPLLRLSASGLVYRPFPHRTWAINWVDVERISARATRRSIGSFSHITILTLWFTLQPYAPYLGDKQQMHSIDLNTWLLTRRPEELVRLIRTYHDVQWSQEEFNNAQRAATDVTRRQRLRDYKRRQSS